MSEFHGGYLVQNLGPALQEPLLRAVRSYFDRHQIPRREMSLMIATRQASPVTLVAVRGGPADGKGFCTWHYENAALGSELARACGRAVWTYCYENQSGFEMTAAFSPEGQELERQEADWDTVHHELGLGDSDADRVRFRAALPLGRLAAHLGVLRDLLEMDLGYDTPSCALPLDGDPDPEALGRYLAGPLLSLPRPPPTDGGQTIKLYFTSVMAEEMEALAERLAVPLGTLLWVAWEGAKPDLHAATPGIDDEGAETPPMPAPPACFPDELELPPAAAAEPLPRDADKVMIGLALPARVLEEIQTLAHFADRSMSWLAQQAYTRTRARLLGARTRSPRS